jgi:spore germination protein GerM
VAVRKTTGKKSHKGNSQGSQAVVIFWLVFVIIIAGVFLAKRETIYKNFNIFKTRLTAPAGTEGELLAAEEEETVVIEPPSAPVRQTAPPVTAPETKPEEKPEVKPQTTAPERPAIQQTQRPQTPIQAEPRPQTPAPVQTRDRSVYFAQINNDGQILQSKVTRRVPVSDSPMQDALNVLFVGPSAEELNRGILNLIPANTRILSATVRGNTAYISFSEDFLFNTFGVEGYVAQLRQIVWTVTEFQNVNDVQILIEGRRMDYLGEGIWIGSPISRQSF